MLRSRIIPVLLLRDGSLVKTVQFNRFVYVGDPCNTVRIFNELEVDELLILDIDASRYGRQPELNLLKDIASECFMPLAYGGGIRTIEDAELVLKTGFEKIAINSSAIERPNLITECADRFGSQAVIVSLDVGQPLFGSAKVFRRGGMVNTGLNPIDWAREAVERGTGEILLTSIQREGTWSGFDVPLIRSISDAVNVPVIAHGGAGSLAHIAEVLKHGGASAVGLGSMVTFQKKGMGVLINFPDERQLRSTIE